MTLRDDFTNATVSLDDHPDHHNDVAAAVNALTGASATPPTPIAPTGVAAVAGPGQATVSWTGLDPGYQVSSYTVTASPGGATASGSGTSATVTGLSNGTAYTFTVTATNAVGTGPASTASNSVTPTTGPGGLGIVGCIAWWDADQITGASNGAQLASWDDSSGNGNTATQATALVRPQYIASWTNGQPATSYNGTGYTFATTLTQAEVGAAMTVFAVCEVTAATNGAGAADQRVLSNQTSLTDSNGVTLDTYAASGNAWRVLASGGEAVAATATLNTPSIISATFGGGSEYLNGDKATGIVNYALTTSSPYYLGSLAGTTRYFTGRIGEVIVFNRKLTDGERHQIEGYLGTKYNITVVQE
jgi:large repetitive protein